MRLEHTQSQIPNSGSGGRRAVSGRELEGSLFEAWSGWGSELRPFFQKIRTGQRLLLALQDSGDPPTGLGQAPPGVCAGAENPSSWSSGRPGPRLGGTGESGTPSLAAARLRSQAVGLAWVRGTRLPWHLGGTSAAGRAWASVTPRCRLGRPSLSRMGVRKRGAGGEGCKDGEVPTDAVEKRKARRGRREEGS